MPQPPLLPEVTLARVHRLARLDGGSVLAVASFFALLGAMAGDVSGAAIALLIAGAGAFELHGATMLSHGEKRGMDWLVGSQLFLLGTLLAYCALRLTHVDLTPLRASFEMMQRSPMFQRAWAANEEAGITKEQFLQQTYTLTYTLIALATLLYQGGMTLYYQRRRRAVERALNEMM